MKITDERLQELIERPQKFVRIDDNQLFDGDYYLIDEETNNVIQECLEELQSLRKEEW